MSTRRYEFSPRASVAGYQIGRRGLLKAGAGVAGAAALGLTMGPRLASAQLDLGSATGDLSFGSNYSNEVPKAGLQASIDAFPNTECDRQHQYDRPQYLPGKHHHLPAKPGRCHLLVRRLPHAVLRRAGSARPDRRCLGPGSERLMSEGFKLASTGHDGLLYFVPFNYYSWGIYYRPSVFEENELDPADHARRAEGAGRRDGRPPALLRLPSAMAVNGRRWAPSISSTSASTATSSIWT